MPPSRRAVVDAMTWASGFVQKYPTSASSEIFRKWRQGEFVSLLNGELLDEIAKTLAILKVPQADITELLALICIDRGCLISIRHQKMGCEDEEDDHLFETAVEGSAGFVVSKDRKVLELPSSVREYMQRRGIYPIHPAKFRDILSVSALEPTG